MTKLVRLIDQKRCMGCRACIAACATENHFTPDAPWNVMVEYEVGTYPKVKKVFNTMNCMHCEHPSCKMACDRVGAKAISKNAFGVVTIDYEKCIGCGYCASVCPYGVPQLNKTIAQLSPGKEKLGAENLDYADRHPTHRKKSNTAEKCTFCTHKLEQAVADGKVDRIGKDQAYTPSCDLVCPTQARMFGDLDDPNSDISKRIKETGAKQLKTKFGNSPQVYYVLEEGAVS
ncbi:MAG: 4Fe-4S dicluster domain-containing protein [Rhodoferax sp.]|nr:4Fe-4S dicluster domain-containing protein [Betaproteobacteria bacterium]NCN98092.1 4Fe-4S dicluster domain-containing protein [Rhodoferax sp.]OIP12823.1 MAG: 4Fe-4S ferredoxin [Comamonadaceae bacterium CG2_30_57_122]PIZ22217.1 MAG: 4Fe-4S ferredoxin [Comamonadaceae bacterium CG_4_10_14_0_8_um_filter_57_29]PJC14786.1 MAG: 4Fe-4S ferredoxin [Comamonadaceae bacterium CG_4_9_14_0_8_um_filter_57_21]